MGGETLSAESRLRRTVWSELVRTSAISPIAAAFRGSGVGVLVAINVFEAAGWLKACVAAASAIGMLLGAFGVTVAARLRLPASKAIAIAMGAAVPGMLLAAFAPSVGIFAAGILTSIPLLGAVVPLTTHIWEQNASPEIRGRVFSHVALGAAVFSVGVTAAVARYLDSDIAGFRLVLVCFAGLLCVASVAATRMPSRPVDRSRHNHHPWSCVSLLWQDRLFGYMCIVQMFVGIGNLATIPMRAEFAASTERGVGYGAGMALLLTLVIPECSRLVFVPIYGRLFDRLNFMVVRMSINILFILSMVLFFTQTMALQVLGSICYGAGLGAGGVAWNLWVTKFAPAERTADYMALHVSLTGLRGIIAPQLSYAALIFLTVPQVGWIGAGLVAVSTVMVAAVVRRGDRSGWKRHGCDWVPMSNR
jgi:hypothetical protein